MNILPVKPVRVAYQVLPGLMLGLFLLSNFSLQSQVDSSEIKEFAFFLFKTEDDFFSGRRMYRGQFIPSEDTWVIRYTLPGSKRKYVLNLQDSCSHYFGYQLGDETQIRPEKDPANPTYYSFGGGNKDIYCLVYGTLANYDKKGYLLGLTAPGGLVHMYFVDRSRGLNMVQLDEILKAKPRLLGLYKTERARYESQEWNRNKLAVSIKYFKLFLSER
jgi:hypothetical protein